MAYGKVVQIIGPVIDCEFAKGEIPKINDNQDHEELDPRRF